MNNELSEKEIKEILEACLILLKLARQYEKQGMSYMSNIARSQAHAQLDLIKEKEKC